MVKRKKWLVWVAVFILIAAAVALTFVFNHTQIVNRCTQEEKICPDGSTIGRISPNCEFALCPDISIECNQDSDCIKSGCSGTICQSKNEEPAITPCIYLKEYDCYKNVTCGCFENKCNWKEQTQLQTCIQKERR